ncbi:MAG TPA: hypothetical protein VHE35_13555 [Kofleriaceae bacterium]|nr:hypothetical protein [Kofleriaceae bacterium]
MDPADQTDDCRGADPSLVDVRAAERVYASLTVLATTFDLPDEQLARAVRAVALAHVLEGARVLARGSTRAWARTPDVCPPWPLGLHTAAAAAFPSGAAHLVDGLVLLQLYNLAARIPIDAARATTTTAVGQALLAHLAGVADALT